MNEIAVTKASGPVVGVEGGVAWIAHSEAMRALLDQVERAARLQSPVMITGGRGSGKSTLGEYLHARSARGRRAFVCYRPVSRAAGVVGQELFGTGDGGAVGVFEQADTGTLFMQDITQLPLELQPRFLQVLERGSVRVTGSDNEIPIDVRLITATDHGPEEALRTRQLRADLYTQLTTIRLEMPALCERSDDIPALARLFVQQYCNRLGHPLMDISPDAMQWLLSNSWPGNVRELAGVIERAVALANASSTRLGLVDLTVSAFVAPPEHDFLDRAVVRQLTIADVESEYIARVLHACNGNRVETARRLGITRRTLIRKLGEGR